MKALWRKYFHIPSEGYLSDRVFMAHLTLNICVILLCLGCMAYAAYALFSYDAAAAIQIPN